MEASLKIRCFDFNKKSYSIQGFIQDFQFGGGDVVCGLTGWASTFPRSRPEMVLKALWFHFADK